MSTPSTSFGILAEPVQRWIWDKGWSTLRDIQERSIPLLATGDQDAIIAAATASGKTEAAFLPLISRVLDDGSAGDGFDLVYISPLKALINDQFRRLEDLCERIELPVYPWHGDVSASIKAKARKARHGILLITPESLEAMFVLRGLEIPAMFGRLQAVVVDELHAMLDTERGIHLRSLLNRLEIATKRRIRRIGLSATLGDMGLARSYLRPGDPDAVALIKSESEGQALKLQIRGYRLSGEAPDSSAEGQEGESLEHDDDAPAGSTEYQIATHIFDTLRGTQNLVFAGSRQSVEVYSDLLARMSEQQALPNEFYPHHANLSRDHRTFIEKRLKDAQEPTTAVCTSTLELGIDIGDVEAVAQIGAPFSVASLRQRLGRSGRRPGRPAILRMYIQERSVDPRSHPADLLRLRLVRSIAMVDLLLEGWCEPPRPQALHLSTLVQQTLSVIAERGGAKAPYLFAILCERGPFHLVDRQLFARLLRQIGDPEVALIEQSPDGTLMLGREGERVVEHYGFYAVFHTPEEYRVMVAGKLLGTLPLTNLLAPDMTVIFSGRRWRVVAIHDREKVIEVSPDARGRPPMFGGGGGSIHDTVVQRMRAVLAADSPRRFLDRQATGLLEDARAWFRRLGLHERNVIDLGDGSTLLATWAGTDRTNTLALAIQGHGMSLHTHDGLLDVSAKTSDVIGALEQMSAAQAPSGEELALHIATPATEKYHQYFNQDLLMTDAISNWVVADAVPMLAGQLLETDRVTTWAGQRAPPQLECE
ncbi:DEAD/DEAH box helicase [Thalassobaculum sp.]|uniref:DEAD/DEAH box helicase n=1 Tax=Thalassobaculum sp. TaxID=2022740 RepID=UPI0032EBAE51